MDQHALRQRARRVLGSVAAASLAVGVVAGSAFAGSPGEQRPVSGATTPAWVDGRTVTVQYPRPFFCDTSVSAASDSGCEVGEAANVGPTGRTNLPELYVLVPLFAPTAPLELHCPDAGDCVNHPDTLDLTRVFGPGTENAALPPHSHILDDPAGGWWTIEVVGVLTQEAWDELAAGRDEETMDQVIADGGAVGPIPSNLFLFFNVVGR